MTLTFYENLLLLSGLLLLGAGCCLLMAGLESRHFPKPMATWKTKDTDHEGHNSLF
jgi:hypothetical protein